jgi:hypothetical protein
MASKSVEAANTQKRKHISSSYSRKEKNTGDGKRTKEEEEVI